MQENNWYSITCNLCGSNGASVRCEKCLSKAFCISCDDMYHRHPKRRFHLRKAVALEMPKQAKHLLESFDTSTENNWGHPSKMPIPPPRRKRKGLTLSGIKGTFANTGNILRRIVNQEKPVPPVAHSRTDSPQVIAPMIEKPMKILSPNLTQNHTKVMPYSLRPLPQIPVYKQDSPPPPPPPKFIPQIYENIRKSSLPTNSLHKTMSLERTYNGESDMCSNTDQRVPPLPPKLRSNSLQRKNYSLHDLNETRIEANTFQTYPQLLCPHNYHYPQHYINNRNNNNNNNNNHNNNNYWGTASLTNSMEELQLNNYDCDDDSDELDSEALSRKSKNRNRYRKANMKRSQSAVQLVPVSPIPPPSPYFCYYYQPSPYGPPSPMISNMSERKFSIDRESSTSSSKDKKSLPKCKRNCRKRNQKYVGSDRVLSDSGGRTFSSSSVQQTDDDEEHFFSASNDDDSSNDNCSDNNARNGEWTCRFCTFINDETLNICDMCCKTRKKLVASDERLIKNKQIINKKRPSIDSKSNRKRDSESDIIFDQTLISEQQEIEKELRRRLENERRIEKENEKIVRREEFFRRKSLGLPVNSELSKQVRNDVIANVMLVNYDEKQLNVARNLNHQKTVEKQEETKNVEKVEIGICTEPESKSSSTVNESTNTELEQNEEAINSLNLAVHNNSDTKNKTATNDTTNNQYLQNALIEVTRNLSSHLSHNSQSNFQHYPNNQHIIPSQQQPYMTMNQQNDYMQQFGGMAYTGVSPILAPQPFRPNNQFGYNNAYPSPYPHNSCLNYGSHTSLDQISNTSQLQNSAVNNNPVNNNVGSRYASCEDLQSITSNNENVINNNNKQSNMDSNFHLIQLLRNAEKSGFTADDLEVAINFNPTKPLEWLEDNWLNMVETVMTLSNNQIMQNERKKGTKKLNQFNLITDKEAKIALRISKGNIWQAIEKCINKKVETNKAYGEAKSSLSIKIAGLGSGKDNEDVNFVDASDRFADSDDTINSDDSDLLLTNDRETSPKISLKNTKINTNAQNRLCDRVSPKKSTKVNQKSRSNENLSDIATNKPIDDKLVEGILTNWRIEKESNIREKSRLREEENERRKLLKMIELKKIMTEFDSEDSLEEELNMEIEQTLSNNAVNEQNDWKQMAEDEGEHRILDDSDRISDNNSDIEWEKFSAEENNSSSDHNDNNNNNNEMRFIDDASILESFEEIENEIYSNEDSDDNTEEFEKIEARMQLKIDSIKSKVSGSDITSSKLLTNKINVVQSDLDNKNKLKVNDNTINTAKDMANSSSVSRISDHINHAMLAELKNSIKYIEQTEEIENKNKDETIVRAKEELDEMASNESLESMAQIGQIDSITSDYLIVNNQQLLNEPIFDQTLNSDLEISEFNQNLFSSDIEKDVSHSNISVDMISNDQLNSDEQSGDQTDFILPSNEDQQINDYNNPSEASDNLFIKMDDNEDFYIEDNETKIIAKSDLIEHPNKSEKTFQQIDETLEKSLEDLKQFESNEKFEDESKADVNSASIQASLQMPVFSKQKGCDKIRKASLHKSESNASRFDSDLSSNDSEESDEIALKANASLNFATQHTIEKRNDVTAETLSLIENCEQSLPKTLSQQNILDSGQQKQNARNTIINSINVFKSKHSNENSSITINETGNASQSTNNVANCQTNNVSDKNIANENMSSIEVKTNCAQNLIELSINSNSSSMRSNILNDIQCSENKESNKQNNISDKTIASQIDKQLVINETNNSIANRKRNEESIDICTKSGSNACAHNLICNTNFDDASAHKTSENTEKTKITSTETQITNRSINLIDENTVENLTNNSENEHKQDIVTNKISYDPNFGWARTHYECELCAETYPISEIVVMISCTHYACRECLSQYLSVQIREKQKLVIVCPFCDEPNIDQDDDERIFEYLALLDLLIKHLVPNDIHELFQRKLRDRALIRDPNFRWCNQCSSGFIAPNPQAKTVMCPDCQSLTCAHCRKPWKKQHFNITCEQFAEWEQAMDPEFAQKELDKHLKEFGIDCPNCKFQYQLAKGGCMHFRCIQCSYDFCGGCKLPFKMGSRCGLSAFCSRLGLHAHHPRNCLFYLRDKEVKDLQQLLDKHNIEYKEKLESVQTSTRCPVMEQRITDSGMKDMFCGRYVEHAGLCRLHYKEYLGDLIWKNNIDPIVIFNEEELEIVLKRANIRLPQKSNIAEYKRKLVEMILENLPLVT